MMTDLPEHELTARLKDLQQQSERRQMLTASPFLNEEELAEAEKVFPESALVRYEGGYPAARKKRVIFLNDPEDDFSDAIVCLRAEIDQRFLTIGHRDVLGALMSLQIDRHSFGDFWLADDCIYLYTYDPMARFLCEQLTRISRLSVSFHRIAEHPAQAFHTQRIEAVIASPRMDAIVAALAHCSRQEASEMIRAGKIQVNHKPLAEGSELCDNGSVISIRGVGRFTYAGILRQTRKNRIVAEFLQTV